MKHNSRLRSDEQAQQIFSGQQARETREFSGVEELLRHDALHTPVPPSIAGRLRESIGSLKPNRSWWRRLFGQ